MVRVSFADMEQMEVRTASGYRLRLTVDSPVSVVTPDGAPKERSAADIQIGDVLRLSMGGGFGKTRFVPMPVADEAYYTNDSELCVPDVLTHELAELVGYFMGDGSLHSKGLRFCVAAGDADVAQALTSAVGRLFHLPVHGASRQGYLELAVHSVRLARWWVAAGFAKHRPSASHSGKGWTPHVPVAILESQDEFVIGAFLRGLFEADGTVTYGGPCLATVDLGLADQVRTTLLALGIATTTAQTTSGRGSSMQVIRTRNVDHAATFMTSVGFIGARKSALVQVRSSQTAKRDLIHLPVEQWLEAAPLALLPTVRQALRRTGAVPRSVAKACLPSDHEALRFLYERVERLHAPSLAA